MALLPYVQSTNARPNIYESEQRVFYSEKPTRYFGWQFSFGGEMVDSHRFSKKKHREDFIKKVGEALAKEFGDKAKELDAYKVAALTILYYEEDDDHCQYPLATMATEAAIDSNEFFRVTKDLDALYLEIENGLLD